jgi:hypothetical protein
MATQSKAAFAATVARIQSEPADIQVPVKKIELDLSLPGILARVQVLASEAHKKGDIVEERFKEIVATVDKLKDAVAELDPRQLLMKLPGWKDKK